jgi:hypothetical protein
MVVFVIHQNRREFVSCRTGGTILLFASGATWKRTPAQVSL